MNLSQYSTIIFDCDGVVLDSNRIKTEAFRAAAYPYGTAAADALVAYHVANGGISRYKKFATFLEDILPEHEPNALPGRDGPNIEQLLTSYAKVVRTGLMTCPVAFELERLRASTPQSRWLIVSGGDQEELRQIFNKRGIAPLFDGGIFGSPDSKDTILARELSAGIILEPALFLGDSLYDYQAAKRVGIDFVLVSGWSEFANWQEFTALHNITCISYLSNLLET